MSTLFQHLFGLVDSIHKARANIKPLKEEWLFTIFAGVSPFECDPTHGRTKDGLAAARARGRKDGWSKANDKARQAKSGIVQGRANLYSRHPTRHRHQ